jgi:hypothetical protein
MLVAGEGLGEDETNGAAARPGAAAREGRQGRRECFLKWREERVYFFFEMKGKGEEAVMSLKP